MRRGVVAIGMGLLALTACGGGSDADPIDRASTTTEATVTTLVETSSTTSTSTSTSTTTEPPATTIDPTEALIAEIEADLNEGEQALFAAGAEPDNSSLRAELEIYFSGEALSDLEEFLDGLVSDGLLVRPNSDVPSVLRVFEIAEVDDAAQPSSVIALVCRVDAAVVYDPLVPGGGIVDDEVATVVARSQLGFASGTWRLDGGYNVEDRVGATTCDP